MHRPIAVPRRTAGAYPQWAIVVIGSPIGWLADGRVAVWGAAAQTALAAG